MKKNADFLLKSIKDGAFENDKEFLSEVINIITKKTEQALLGIRSIVEVIEVENSIRVCIKLMDKKVNSVRVNFFDFDKKKYKDHFNGRDWECVHDLTDKDIDSLLIRVIDNFAGESIQEMYDATVYNPFEGIRLHLERKHYDVYRGKRGFKEDHNLQLKEKIKDLGLECWNDDSVSYNSLIKNELDKLTDGKYIDEKDYTTKLKYEIEANERVQKALKELYLKQEKERKTSLGKERLKNSYRRKVEDDQNKKKKDLMDRINGAFPGEYFMITLIDKKTDELMRLQWIVKKIFLVDGETNNEPEAIDFITAKLEGEVLLANVNYVGNH